jgi:hypothetical protein
MIDVFLYGMFHIVAVVTAIAVGKHLLRRF